VPGGVEITLLGRFAVGVDGVTVDPAHWRRRPAANLVKVLALTPGLERHREQVIDQLWPDLPARDATPRLHKAAHYARRALGREGVVTEGEMIRLFPGRSVTVDVVRFETAAAAALDGRATSVAPDDGGALDAALAIYGGDLLPADRYEPWTEAPREHLAHLHRQLLRAAGRWSELLALEPSDEQAHVEVMRAHIERRDRAAALAQFDRLEQVLADELGVEPSAEALEMRAAAIAIPGDDQSRRQDLPPQEIRFCHAPDGVRLAYASIGSGPPMVKAANWLSHLEYDWESSLWRHWLVELAQRRRLVRYDERGCGLSDWDVTTFSLDAWVEDLATVIDAAGLDQAPFLGISQGAAVAVEYAARHPERVSALVLYGGYIHGPVARARTADERRLAELLPELAELGWGRDDPSFRQVFTARFLPDGTPDQCDEFNELQRRSTSPQNAAAFMRGFGVIDVTEAAQLVRCPTLVVHLRGDHGPPLEEGRLLASLIPGSRFVSLEGTNHLMLATDPAWPRFLAEFDRFVAETT
jgi:pimeloyl-ACP methyl ester carboxylesterase/DNA-binding SARP family transcriptional activator